MTLNELLAALANNEMLSIEIVKTENEKENVLIEFEASGYEQLSAELLASTVSEIRISSEVSIMTGVTIKIV